MTGTNHAGDSVTQGPDRPDHRLQQRSGPDAAVIHLGRPRRPDAAPGHLQRCSSIGITGALTLDGGGDPNAVFIFQAGSTLTTGSASSGQPDQRRPGMQRLLAGRQLGDARHRLDVPRNDPRPDHHHGDHRRDGRRPGARPKRRGHARHRHDRPADLRAPPTTTTAPRRPPRRPPIPTPTTAPTTTTLHLADGRPPRHEALGQEARRGDDGGVRRGTYARPARRHTGFTG